MLRNLKYSVLILVLFSCGKENRFDCFKSNGPVISSERDLGAFKHIMVYDKIDLNLIQGNEYKVEIMAGKKIMSNISTSNTNGTLVIENNNKCNFVRGYDKKITVNITVPKIDRIESHGVGAIRFNENFVQDSIFLLAENSGDIYVNGNFKRITTGSHGNGDIYADGICDTLTVYTFGTNSFKGENLTIKTYVFIENISIGDVRINAPLNGKLECNIWRNGNIYYRGNPTSINDLSDGTAKGKLIKE